MNAAIIVAVIVTALLWVVGDWVSARGHRKTQEMFGNHNHAKKSKFERELQRLRDEE